MGRLPRGFKQRRANKIRQLLQKCRLGLTEQEIAQELGLHRRTVNNYLHQLDSDELAHREGCRWYPG